MAIDMCPINLQIYRFHWLDTMTDTVIGMSDIHSQPGSCHTSELTDEEKEIINNVIARAEKMEAMEQERIG